jgi:hypothetical protein
MRATMARVIPIVLTKLCLSGDLFLIPQWTSLDGLLNSPLLSSVSALTSRSSKRPVKREKYPRIVTLNEEEANALPLTASISQSHIRRKVNGLILGWVAVFAVGLEDLHDKLGALQDGKTAARRVRRKEILAPKAGCSEGSILGSSVSWNSLAEQ